MKLTVFSFLFILMLTPVLFAQASGTAGKPFITNFSPKEYGAGPQNWAVVQDQRGVMYFGNSNGILEYDGSNWRLIQLPNSSTVRSLAIDEQGRIYVGGVGEFGYLAPDSLGQIQFISLLPQLPPGDRQFENVWQTDAAKDGIYFKTGYKLFRWADGKIKIWRMQQRLHVSAVLDGTFYIRLWEVGLTRMEGDTLALVPGGEQFADERIYVMLPYDEKRTLIGTRSRGLYLYDGETFSPFKTEADDILQNQLYLPGAVLADGSFALNTTSNGLVIIDRQGRLQHHITKASGLFENTVFYVYSDRQDGLWLALGNGLSRLEILTPLSRYEEDSGLYFPIYDIIRHKEILYVATDDGVYWKNNVSAAFEPVSGISSQCYDLLVVEEDLLAISFEYGLFRIEAKHAEILRPSVNYDFRVNYILTVGDNPRRLFAALENGIAVMKEENGQWVDEGIIPDSPAGGYWLAKSIDGSLWVNSSNGCFQIVLPSEDDSAEPGSDLNWINRVQIKQYGSELGLPDGDNLSYSIAGEIYTGTRKGLFHFQKSSQSFVPDTVFSAVSFNPLGYNFYMTGDAAGRVWLNLGAESAVATPREDGTYEIDKRPFLRFSDLQVSVIYPEEDAGSGTWFGGVDKLIHYNPAIKKEYTADYPALIRNVTVGEDSLIFGGAFAGRGDRADRPYERAAFSYSDNTVRFQYAAPTYDNPGETRFQTMLEGFDNRWSSWTPKTEKEFINLPAGDYRFRVQARNIYQHLSEEAAFAFKILPPWYSTWWAYLLYVLAAGAIVFALIRVRTRQVEERSRELEKTVEERTHEIQQRVEELAVINSVQEGLVAQTDVQAIFDFVGDRIWEMYDAQAVIIIAYHHEREKQITHYLKEKGQRFNPEPAPFNDLHRHLIKTREPVLINDDAERRVAEFGMKTVKGTELPKSLLFVPLVAGSEVKGCISLQNMDREHAFSDANVRLLSTLANSMSVALDNARLFEETRQRAAELGTVNNISQALAEHLALDELIQLVGEQMRDIFHADIVYVALHDKASNMINFPYGYGDEYPPMPFGTGLTSRIIETGKPQLVNKSIDQIYDEFGIKPYGAPATSYLGVPIPFGKENIGVISVQSTTQENRFEESDMRLLNTIAANVGAAIHTARLFEEAEESRAQAEKANEAKSSFLSTVSHELRTPLTSVVGFAKIIKKRLEERIFPEIKSDDRKVERAVRQVDENIQVVVSEGERLTALINDVLDLAKIEAGRVDWHMETLAVPEIIQRATAATSSLFEDKKLTLKNEIPADLPEITGDRDRLIQVVINFLSNAVKFTDEGSVTCRAVQDNGEIQVSVIDTGFGISKEDQPKVFEKFRQVGDTLTDKPKGTGLGLPICREIIEHHGGRIWVESEVQVGSTFSFALPLNGESIEN